MTSALTILGFWAVLILGVALAIHNGRMIQAEQDRRTRDNQLIEKGRR